MVDDVLSRGNNPENNVQETMILSGTTFKAQNYLQGQLLIYAQVSLS